MIKKEYVGYFAIVFSIIFPYIFLKAFYTVNFDLYLWLLLLMLFISLHFFIKPSVIWDFIYRKRWFICLGILLFVLIMGYNTSSIGMYNSYVQPNLSKEEYNPFYGKLEPIRSDEWATSTPLKMSQFQLNDPLSKNNNIMMAKDNIVTFYPNMPTKSISSLTTPDYLGYLLFGEERGLTVDTLFEWIILAFVSFDFMMIITKNKKIYSLAGALIISFAPMVVWWSCYNILLYGEAIVVMVNSFVHSKTKISKLLKVIVIGWLISCDIMTMYPAWLIPFSYVFFLIVLYILIKNTKKEDVKSTILFIILALCIGGGLVLPSYLESKDVYQIVNNTVYPGKRFSVGGTGWETLFNYANSLFLWYKPTANNSESAQFIGLFPLPIILGIAYIIKHLVDLYKNKKQNKKSKSNSIDLLTVFLVVISSIYIINAFFNIPLLSKITLLSYSPTQRLTNVIEYVCILIMFRLIAISEKKDINVKKIVIAVLIAILSVVGVLYIFNSFNNGYLTLKSSIVIIALLIFFFTAVLLNYKKLNYLFLITFAILSFGSGIMVHPVSKGVAVLHDKPLAKKISEIVKKDPDARWISMNNSFVIGNYMAANGARTINSTNMVPNLELWKKIDADGKYNDIYNRYAHVYVESTEEESYFELNYTDSISLYLNMKDFDKLDIDYIVSSVTLTSPKNIMDLDLLYSEDGQNIYQVSYN